MNIIFEFDDLHWDPTVNCIEQIEYLINRYPDIKLSFFTPVYYNYQYIYDDKQWCDKIRKYITSNNLTLGVHGLTHSVEEFKHKTYEQACNALITAESIFNKADLPFVKIFRGPHWGINDDTYKALIDLNYKSIYTHFDYLNLTFKYPNIKSIIYNWNLNEEFNIKDNWHSDDIVIGHGHTHNVCGNGIQESLNRIINFIENNNPKYLNISDI